MWQRQGGCAEAHSRKPGLGEAAGVPEGPRAQVRSPLLRPPTALPYVVATVATQPACRGYPTHVCCMLRHAMTVLRAQPGGLGSSVAQQPPNGQWIRRYSGMARRTQRIGHTVAFSRRSAPRRSAAFQLNRCAAFVRGRAMLQRGGPRRAAAAAAQRRLAAQKRAVVHEARQRGEPHRSRADGRAHAAYRRIDHFAAVVVLRGRP